MEALVEACVLNDLVLFERALDRLCASSRRDHWQHKALTTTLRLPLPDMRVFFVHKLLQCDKPPVPAQDETFMANAIIDSNLECIPYLHAAGFKLDLENDEMEESMGRMIGRGIWPHPDLIHPNLFSKNIACEAFCERLFMSIFTEDKTEQHIQMIQRVAKLGHADNIALHFERTIGDMAGNPTWRSDLTPDIITKSFMAMIEAGWFKLDKIQEIKDQALIFGNSQCDIIEAVLDLGAVEHERLGLDRGTPEAQSKPAKGQRL